MKTETTASLTHNLCELELIYKTKVKNSDRPGVSCSADAERYLRTIWSPHMERIEEFVVLCLNRANKVLGWAKISQGGLTGTAADPKVIFQLALKANACSIILAHNHPSGNTNPSEADKQLTRKLSQAGNLFDLPVLDHLILTEENYYSFADNGEL